MKSALGAAAALTLIATVIAANWATTRYGFIPVVAHNEEAQS